MAHRSGNRTRRTLRTRHGHGGRPGLPGVRVRPDTGRRRRNDDALDTGGDTMITTYDRRRTIPLVVSTRLDTDGYMTAHRYGNTPAAPCDTRTRTRPRRTLRNGAVRPHPRPPPDQ